jgi:hypothetical protein
MTIYKLTINFLASQDPVPAPKSFIKWMFFLSDYMGKSIVVCIHPRFFVTFRHGSHLEYKDDDVLTIYKVNEEIQEQVGIEVSVVKVHEELDFVLLKSKFEVVEVISYIFFIVNIFRTGLH